MTDRRSTPELNTVILGYLRTVLSIYGVDGLIGSLNAISGARARRLYAEEFGVQEHAGLDQDEKAPYSPPDVPSDTAGAVAIA